MTATTDGIRLPKADPYNVFWQTDDGPAALAVALDQFASWLRERHIDVDPATPVFKRTDRYRLTCMQHETDWRRDFQARLVEFKDSGDWTTEVTVSASERQGGWLRMSVGSSSDIAAKPPKVSRYILESGLFRDGGSVRLTPEPKHVSIAGVEELAAVLTDVERQGLVFVAGSGDGISFDKWRQRVGRWSRDVVGLAEVYLLDPPATAELEAVLGPDYTTAPFTLRTYKPGVDPAMPEGARRHRYLSTRRLADSSDAGLARLLGRVAREHNATRQLPDVVKQVFRAFSRLETRLLTKSMAESTAVLEPVASQVAEDVLPLTVPLPEAKEANDVATLVEQVETYTQQLGLVQRVLGVELITEENLSRFTQRPAVDEELFSLFRSELDQRESAIEELQEAVATLRESLEETQLELDDESLGRSKADDEVRWLRGQFVALEKYDLAYSGLPGEQETEYPDSFEELVRRLENGELPGVVFTGDRACAEELDSHDGLDTAVRGAWDSCLTLRDYLRYRRDGHNCGVYQYLREAPAEYRTVSANKYASTESESVIKNARWAAERCLPVPTAVEPSGLVQMFAHFKCALVGMVSPRLHYYDDFTGTGSVYIGYIGRHLTTKGTN